MHGINNLFALSSEEKGQLFKSDIINLVETWTWNTDTFKKYFPENYDVYFVNAIKPTGVGRPSGGIITLIKKYTAQSEIIEKSQHWLIVKIKKKI